MDNPLCIYHANCADGFMAATIMREAIGAENIDFHPGQYQKPPPDVSGRDVIMVDFSYKRPVILEMAASARSITILDHHASAERDLVDLPDNVNVEFDMNRSGAMMAWNYCHPDAEPPMLVQHVQDRDLWRFQLGGTEAVQAALFSYPYDFSIWGRFLRDDCCSELLHEGRALVRKHHKDVAELISVAQDWVCMDGAKVPLLNCPYFFSSEAGHRLAEGHPFAACYYMTPAGPVFSLRSVEGGHDVSKVAVLYGGGGHKHAAGFTVPHCQFLRLEGYWLVKTECA